MTRKELIDKLQNIEWEVKEIREYLSQSKSETVTPVNSPLVREQDSNWNIL